MQHGPSIGSNMTQDEHSQAPKFWVANIFPIQKSPSNTRNKPNLKMEVHKPNFEDADFDLSIPNKHTQDTLEVKLTSCRLEMFNTNNPHMSHKHKNKQKNRNTTHQHRAGKSHDGANTVTGGYDGAQHNRRATKHTKEADSGNLGPTWEIYCRYTPCKVKTHHNILWVFAWRCCIVSIAWFSCMSMHVYF